MKKSLFNAGFEESLNLEDDNLIQYMVNDTNGRKIYTKPFSMLRKIFSILGMLVLAFLSTLGENPSKEFSLQIWGVNLFPSWLCLVTSLICWLLSRKKLYRKYLDKIPFISIHNLVLYILWMLFGMNLLFMTFLGQFLTLFGVSVPKCLLDNQELQGIVRKELWKELVQKKEIIYGT